MITIEGRLLKYGEVWFDEEVPVEPRVDVINYRLRPAPLDGAQCSPFLSLVSDLGRDESELIGAFGSNNRYKINRAESKDDLTVELMPDPREALDEFCAFFDAFAEQKRIVRSYRRGLEAACDAGKLVLGAASRAGVRIVWHAHIVSSHTAALLHSASHFRTKDNNERALVGRANRWLHWREMRWFKQMGTERYDWGGLFADENVPEHASVNRFKREFGGVPVQWYNCRRRITLKGWAYTRLRRFDQ